MRGRVLYIASGMVNEREGLVIRGNGVGASVYLLVNFPFRINVGFFLLNGANAIGRAQAVGRPMRYVYQERLYCKRINAVTHVANLSPSNARLRIARRFWVLGRLFLKGAPDCEDKERYAVAVTNAGIQEAITTCHYDRGVTIIRDVDRATRMEGRSYLRVRPAVHLLEQ